MNSTWQRVTFHDTNLIFSRIIFIICPLFTIIGNVRDAKLRNLQWLKRLIVMTNIENIFSKAQKIDKSFFIKGRFTGRYISFITFRYKRDITFFFAAYLMHPISCLAFQKVSTFSELIQPQIIIMQNHPNETWMRGGNKGFKRGCEKLQEHLHYVPYIKFYD
jgi:hypothetical protein